MRDVLLSQWEPSVCRYCGVRTQREETPAWLCPFRAGGGGQKPHSCFPKWTAGEEQGEVRGSPSQEGRPGAKLVGITQRFAAHSSVFFILSSTNISPTGRAEGSGQFYDVNCRVFTLLRTCLLLKISLKWRHSSSVYLDISKGTFSVLLSLKRPSDVNLETSCKSIWHFSMFFQQLNRIKPFFYYFFKFQWLKKLLKSPVRHLFTNIAFALLHRKVTGCTSLGSPQLWKPLHVNRPGPSRPDTSVITAAHRRLFGLLN